MSVKNNKIIGILILLSTLIFQGCYTQLATTKTIYCDKPAQVKKYYEVTTVQPEQLDSLEAEPDIIIKEYYYWAYRPWFDFDPYYLDYPATSVRIYVGATYQSPWFDPYPSWYSHYNWPYYDYQWWYYPHYAHHGYNHHYYNRPHYAHYDWNWNRADDGLETKKRDWDRRSEQTRNDPIVRGPANVSVIPAVVSEPVAAQSKSDGGNTSTRQVQRPEPAKVERTDRKNGGTTIRRDEQKNNNKNQSSRSNYRSLTTSEIVRSITRKVEAQTLVSAVRTVSGSRDKDRGSGTKVNYSSERSTAEKSKSVAPAKSSASERSKSSSGSKSSRSREKSTDSDKKERSRR
ncbi:MAG: hypothetical protein ABIA75_11560 [Candidatus Neomarinimicrobiota bacterium]